MTARRSGSALALRGIISRHLGDYLAEQARLQQRVDQATTAQGNVRPEAIGDVASFKETLEIRGTATVGTNTSALRPVMLQRGALRTLIARAGTAPAGGECTIWLTANGADVAAVTLQAGEVKRATPGSRALVIESGADLQCRVTAANGAADITITAVFAAA